MRRYVTAYGWASADAPMRSVIAGASTRPSTVSVRPRPTASQHPSTPVSAAPRRLPAPKWRATAAVVEYARKLHTVKAAVNTDPATARPASGRVPRWPTMAVSASR